VGIDGAIGRYFPKIGDIYFGAGYGTFIKGHDLFATTVSTNIIYFSPLAQLGKWRLRQFGNFNFVYGIDRKPTELVNLNADNGIPGYKDDLPVGTSRMVLASQTVFYTPYVFLGFRFAPIVLLGVGMIGKYNQSVLNSRLYQMYGIGLRMKNELLVLNTFQVTIAIYPVLPGGGSDIRMNPVKLTESRFADFDITRPDVLLFE
jgi:hypothetical protein